MPELHHRLTQIADRLPCLFKYLKFVCSAMNKPHDFKRYGANADDKVPPFYYIYVNGYVPGKMVELLKVNILLSLLSEIELECIANDDADVIDIANLPGTRHFTGDQVATLKTFVANVRTGEEWKQLFSNRLF